MNWPTVDPERPPAKRKGRRKKSRRGGRRRGRLAYFLRRLILIAALVALLPFVLTVLYRPSVVHPISTLMVKDLVTLQGYDRRWTLLDAMGPQIQHAVMMSEDGQFCSHWGVDWGELNAVINDALSGERPRGASTIPMQTVKNLFLWHDRSVLRKLLEMPLAIYLDAVLPKGRIMEIYLNIAEWGPNIYGAEAAARHYFGRSASELTGRQAALLAVTLPNPTQRNPAQPSVSLNRLAATIERRAQRAGGYVGCLNP